ncbi:endonuclease domain-containing protein [Hyphobacterium marinum]|uniref:DUF559 domain-containing protein n=1 Tax=Hyphobacterium marinum TaxID=3116574 RepID=A0ABU7LZ14_9PROT|nr:DUF559 domain-containing protein [Hyphobacterium sp. Y6023]MEE2566804.1 DUF559 domain-containing protein [Hyphobacterium sp. Y6023]
MPERLTPVARRLRRDMTRPEHAVWRMLRQRPLGFKFRRQQPIETYVLDFACFELQLVIEVDGGQHANSTTDEIRTRALEALGWTVIRFWNNDVNETPDGVHERILDALRMLDARRKDPSP